MERSHLYQYFKSMDTTAVRNFNAEELIAYYTTIREEDAADEDIFQRALNSDDEDDIGPDSSLDEDVSSNIVDFDDAMRQQYEVAWSLINIAEPSENALTLTDAISLFYELLEANDESVISKQAFGVLGNIISCGDVNRIQSFIDSGIIPKILPVLNENDRQIHSTALRTIEKLLSGSDEQIEKIVVEYNLLKYFDIFLTHLNLNIRKDSLNIICNITSVGSSLQVHYLIKAELLKSILENLNRPEINLQQLASEAICNLTERGNKEIVFELMYVEAIKTLCHSLKSLNEKIIKNSLTSLVNIWKLAGRKYQDYISKIFSENDCAKTLQQIQIYQDSLVVKELIEKLNGENKN